MSGNTSIAEPIAVVGSSCRFPGGASSPSKLWELLNAPRDLSATIPSTRFDVRGFYDADGERAGCTNATRAYLLEDDFRNFDASFFNINPREAEAIDPQQRFLLETVYEGIEASGYSIKQLQGSKTAVYVGLMTADFNELMLRDVDRLPKYFATGTARSIVSNRISYFFDWKGPSMTIDTACSSSLVAVHQAVQALRSGQTKLAVVAGANLILSPDMMISESKLHMLSPSGYSRMWDEGADGYARGEGFAAVVLKPLREALRDGDSIECIIRETGVNQDGRTRGITMPNAESQVALIRDTYARAGLDYHQESDRCQFFEAHGTGTPAGDPIEAEAIYNSFFESNLSDASESKLYVGSVKTVIGHLEGCAGLAGLLKASLALQHGIIPPNLHFNKLNPAIEKFYGPVQIPIDPQPWPSTAGGVRRASCNSFGFGGTNAHVILEAFEEETKQQLSVRSCHPAAPNVTPIIVTANSERSLAGNVEKLKKFLESHPDQDLNQVAFNLRRRSEFPLRLSFSGVDHENLVSQLSVITTSLSQNPGLKIGRRASSKQGPYTLLGVFTGQGAQWPAMGKELLHSSEAFARTLKELDDSLSELEDSPTWSLVKELEADASESRLGEAEISQPLCTAVQVALVDLAALCGIQFNYVVGHSSGEIAAAYAAGFLSARDAIRIAYYRGVHSRLAGGVDGSKGSMMAAGLSYEQGKDFCSRPEFEGTISVAASNAPSSVTLSGDESTIQAAKRVLDEEGTFARVLRVDKAYHSRHMQPCSGPYVNSLRKCRISVQRPARACTWVSSVDRRIFDADSDLSSLEDTYWNQNLTNPVLFSQALETLLAQKPELDLALEVGPHPALKGPVGQNLKAFSSLTLPYFGLLERGCNDVEAFSKALGSVSECLGWSWIDFEAYANSFPAIRSSGFARPLRLPSYAWDHEQTYWREPRLSKAYRSRSEPKHCLLGSQSIENIHHDLRWRNILRTEDLPWLRGHKVEGQVVFPAAGYLAMALEASKTLFSGRQPLRVELQSVQLFNAMLLEDGSDGTEVLFTMKSNPVKNNHLSPAADFAIYSCTNASADAWERHACGSIHVVFDDDGTPSRQRSHTKTNPVPGLTSINVDTFYSALDKIGLNYSDDFRRMSAVSRRMGFATAEACGDARDDLLVHPALLDITFQTIFAAFCWPGDSSLSAPYVPTAISKITFYPDVWSHRSLPQNFVDIDAYLTENNHASLSADLEIMVQGSDRIALEVHRLTATNLRPAEASNDREIFTETVWEMDVSDGPTPENTIPPDSADDIELVEFCERLSYYYLRNLRREVPAEEAKSFEWHFQRLFEFTDVLFSKVESGQHSTVLASWKNDTWEDLEPFFRKRRGQIDVDLISAVGRNLPRIVRGQVPALEVMVENDMLNRIYSTGLGFENSNTCLSGIAKQITHRYARANILEIGAGTGGATNIVLKGLNNQFSSYTFTDISAGFFEHAQERFAAYRDKMVYKTLDIERSPQDQGYEEGAYDIIIASNVLHATSNLAETLRNTRRLLKPGGYLLLLEITSDILRVKLMMSGLPGWWLGGDDGRRYAPTISQEQWDSILKSTGFSGVDVALHDFRDASKHMTSVLASQAVDNGIQMLRNPIDIPWSQDEKVLLVGSTDGSGSKLISSLGSRLHGLRPEVPLVQVESLKDVNTELLSTASLVVCASELDTPYFQQLTENSLRDLQAFFSEAKHVLWVLQDENPYAAMTIGLGRSLRHEMPQLRLQFLSISPDELSLKKVDIDKILGLALRLTLSSKLSDTTQRLWTTEPELVLKGGALWIPRILSSHDRNDRLNASRRSITRSAQPSTEVLEVVPGKGTFDLVLPSPRLNSALSSTQARVRTMFSSLEPVTLDGTRLFLVYGTVAEVGAQNKRLKIGDQVVASSTTNSNIVTVDDTCAVKCSWKDLREDPARTLSFVCSIAVADTIRTTLLARLARPGRRKQSVVLVNDATPLVQQLLSQGESDAIKYIWTTSDPAERSNGRLYVGPSTSRLQAESIQRLSPRALVDLSGTLDRPTVESILPSTRLYFLGRMDLFGMSPDMDEVALGIPRCVEALSNAVSCIDLEKFPVLDPCVVDVRLLQDTQRPRQTLPLLDWTDDSLALSAHVQPLNPRIIFRDDVTYLLVGCLGGLGLSISRFMVSNGARYLALCGRDPSRVDRRVIDELRAMGATVNTFAMDVSDRARVNAVYHEICKSMPPIAGVANAAMVLNDCLFSDMTYPEMIRVLGPKVEGTKHLAELFQDNTLDFFLVFSSTASVVGNRGQSNYGAANLFMAELMRDRRRHGLSGSTIDIGMVLGVGYITQTGVFERQLAKYKFMTLSEHDMHSIFMEGLLAGRPESNRSSEVITGLDRSDPFAPLDDNPFWSSDPRFAHHVLERISHKSEDVGKTSMPVKQLLETADDQEQALAILEEAFIGKLSRITQLPVDNIDQNQPLVQLGVDSLMAVEIRTWFLNELDVDIPVLKILGGGSARDACRTVLAGKVFNKPATVTDESHAQPSQIPQVEQNQRPKSELLQVPSTTSTMTRSTTPLSGRSMTDDKSSLLSEHEQTTDASSLPESSATTPESLSPKLGAKDSCEEVFPSQSEFQATERASYAQERIWFLHETLTDPTTFNVTLSYAIDGPLRPTELAGAFRLISERHESLRTAFFLGGGSLELYQGILPKSQIEINIRSIANVEEVDQAYRSLKEHVYDLEKGKTMRVDILSLSNETHFLILGFHHIVLDGFSAQLLIKDLQSIYALGKVLPPAPKYRDYSVLQRRLVEEHQLSQSIEFWKSELEDMPSSLPLFPFARVSSRKILDHYDICNVSRKLGVGLASKIREVARKVGGSTSFFLYLAVFRELIFRLTKQSDVCIGISDASRADKESLEVIGMFVNMVPLRFKLAQPEQTFGDVLATTSKQVRKALEHSSVPYQALLQSLPVKRSVAENPLFQVLLNYKMGSTNSAMLGNCKAESLRMDDARTGLDVVFEVEEFVDGDCLLSLKGQEYLYSQESLELLISSIVSMLESVTSEPQIPLGKLKVFDANRIAHALEVSKGERVYPDQTQTVVHRFEEHSQSRPTSVAVTQADGQFLTYRQLRGLSHALARSLHGLGEVVAKPVIVACNPSLNSAVAVLGTHYAGCIYVPVDVEHPQERLRSIVEDCNPCAIVCDNSTRQLATLLADQEVPIVNADDISSASDEIAIQSSYADTAYILYTSGSTGKPKGVVVSHGNLACQMRAMQRDADLDVETALVQSSVAFDASIDCIYAAFTSGGSIVIASPDIRRDPLRLAKLMADNKVTYTQMTSSEYNNLLLYGAEHLTHCTSWKNAFCGGEKFFPSLRTLFKKLDLPALRVWNRYGPTEITVSSSMCTVLGDQVSGNADVITCGRPLTNYSVYILDEDLKPVPTGYPGEICVGGGGVARGYLNDPELTKSRFVQDPFATATDVSHGWSTLYRTGDRGYLLDDGSLVFVGRMEGSAQVKIRGNRVELDEIETAIVAASGGKLSSAGVCLKGENADAFLAAYVVVNNALVDVHLSDFISGLASSLPLPRYMRPSSFTVVEELPRTSSGKLDRQALKSLAGTDVNISARDETPLEGLEAVMAEAWAQLLPGEPSLHPDSDFFDVGGNSLLLVRLQKNLEASTGVTVPLAQLFASPVLSDMTALFSGKAEQEKLGEAIDWDKETQLPPDFANVGQHVPKTSNALGMNVLLTGATGFLGGEIVQHLLADETVTHIYCVAVRQSSSTADRLKKHPSKLTVYHGDLSEPRLGLSDADYQFLADTVDVIIHNGADVSFLKSYQTLRKPNFESTKSLAQLALRHHIPFHFVSTGGVVNLTQAASWAPLSAKDYHPPCDGSQGYIASKWASERFLERVADRFGLPVYIHRPASITGEGAPTTDIIQNILQYTRKISLFPAVGDVNWKFDFVPVDVVARDVLESVKASVSEERTGGGAEGEGGPRFYHHCNAEKLTALQLREALGRELSSSGELEEVPVRDWIRQATTSGMSGMVGDTFLDLVEHQNRASFTMMVQA